MIDWGAFTLKHPLPTKIIDSLDLLTGTESRGLSMARTLGGEESDQVTKNGRRVLIGWTGPAPMEVFNDTNAGGSAQSLPRDLSIDPTSLKIVQKFIPELQMLRSTNQPTVRLSRNETNAPMGISPIEIIANFPTECINTVQCGIEVLASTNIFGTGESLKITLDSKLGLVLVDGTSMRNSAVRAAPIPKPMAGSAISGSAFKLHAIVDHSIVEIIINDEIAFVVYVAPYSRDTLGNVRAFGSGNIITDIWKLQDANVN
jgi:sucrose-6-phosphate hydrolase SacC (GH32 family)